MRFAVRVLCVGWVGMVTGCHFIDRNELGLLPRRTGDARILGNDSASAPEGAPDFTEATVRAAVGKAHAVLWTGVEGHAEHRSCFTCHNHGVPMLAFATARDRGFAVPEKDFAELVEFATAYFESNRERFLRGRGPGPLSLGGATDTTGWGLFALEVAGKTPDEIRVLVAQLMAARTTLA